MSMCTAAYQLTENKLIALYIISAKLVVCQICLKQVKIQENESEWSNMLKESETEWTGNPKYLIWNKS